MVIKIFDNRNFSTIAIHEAVVVKFFCLSLYLSLINLIDNRFLKELSAMTCGCRAAHLEKSLHQLHTKRDGRCLTGSVDERDAPLEADLDNPLA